MTVEVAVYLNTLDATYPTGADPRLEGDDHIRQIKRVLQATFPYVTGPILVAQTELNYLTGLSSNLVSQLAAKAPLASPGFSGTPTAPTAATAANSTQIATTAFVQAQKVSPEFTGTPSAPTPDSTSNSTRLATTEFVQTLVAGVGTGDGTSRALMYYFGSF
jgi:hypothetical protein